MREGFKQVEKDEFFRAMGPLNVHPCPRGPWSDETGYLSEWKLSAGAGETVGLSDGRGDNPRYFLKFPT